MRKIEQFTNQYSLSKTLRFRLIPVGNTQKNFELNNLLEEDEQRAKHYADAKRIIDGYHRDYIDNTLLNITSLKGFDAFLDSIRFYSDLYAKSERDKDEIKKIEEAMRKFIANALRSGENYKYLFKQELIKNLLPEYLDSLGDEESKKTIEEFWGFSTYFSGFFKNRENMYSAEEKSTAIAYRCINDNLPKFLDNVKVFKSFNLTDVLSGQFSEINNDFSGIYSTKAEDIFSVDYFPFVLSQKGIELYNSIIGGYTNSDGSKVQGLNEYINLYNQQIDKHYKTTKRLPKLKPLFKQILSEKDTISFIPEKFESDDELLEAVKAFYEPREEEKVDSISDTLSKVKALFSDLATYDNDGIFVKNGIALTTVCSGAFGYWGTVQTVWNEEYDSRSKKKDTEAYIAKRQKAFKNIDSFSITEIQKYADAAETEEKKSGDLNDWIKNEILEKCEAVEKEYGKANELLNNPYTNKKRLYNNDSAIEIIKNALDAVKALEHSLKLFSGTGKEFRKDEAFYGEYAIISERLSEIDALYNKVRNYMTQKPFRTDKIKLNFQNPQFLGGWDRNKESDYSSVLFQKDGNYFIGIMSKEYRNSFKGTDYYSEDSENTYKKMVYKQIPNVAKYISSKQILPQNPPKDIVDILSKKKNDNKSLNKQEIEKFIDYSMNDFLVNYPLILDESGNNYFNFKLKSPSEYETINEFFIDVEKQAYSISFVNVSEDYIDSLVSEGKLYLFRIYNKDFSEYSKGRPNLHTMYFKSLFDENALSNKSIALNGGGEMFYRKASIAKDDIITHPKNTPIKNKNALNKKSESVFGYDIVKDYRYTVDRFMLHIPITLNFTAPGNSNINLDVRKALKECDNNFVIGIDRGERNLLYISVIDSQGKIHEQYSLNEIINEHNGNTYRTDYHALLDAKEKERLESRVNWKAVENIKELKEGYISQVVHKICQLVEKYDAIVVMEDLNFGFKRVRGGKFEKSVYQKFEKMLIDKLNYSADKTKTPEEIGSVLNAYQLTNKFDSFKNMGKQNGFIFYVPAYLTSKIDPTTGFADFLHPRYKSVEASKAFINSFDSILYNAEANCFEFGMDYSKFENCIAYGKKKWTLYTYGNRIETFRNPEKNSEWDSREICLTEAFKVLFEENGIEINGDIKAQILAQSEADFFRRFIKLIALMLQLRNSETGNIDKDYLISPVKNESGKFYISDDYKAVEHADLPKDADANGAYNIARKGNWIIEQIKRCSSDEELKNIKLAISNAEWINHAQNNLIID